MKKVIISIVILMAVTGTTVCFAHKEHGKKHRTTVTKYTCPMHPEVIKNKAGKCPKCGMKLVPVKKTNTSIKP